MTKSVLVPVEPIDALTHKCKKVINDIVSEMVLSGSYQIQDVSEDIFRKIHQSILDHAPKQGEPVAWWDGECCLTRHKELPISHHWDTVIPLYSAPPAPEPGWIKVDHVEEIHIVGKEILIWDGCECAIEYVEVDVDTGFHYLANGNGHVEAYMPLPAPPEKADGNN